MFLNAVSWCSSLVLVSGVCGIWVGQFPAEQQNDTKEFMDKLLDRLELELSDTKAKDVVKASFGATTAEIKVRREKICMF